MAPAGLSGEPPNAAPPGRVSRDLARARRSARHLHAPEEQIGTELLRRHRLPRRPVPGDGVRGGDAGRRDLDRSAAQDGSASRLGGIPGRPTAAIGAASATRAPSSSTARSCPRIWRRHSLGLEGRTTPPSVHPDRVARPGRRSASGRRHHEGGHGSGDPRAVPFLSARLSRRVGNVEHLPECGAAGACRGPGAVLAVANSLAAALFVAAIPSLTLSPLEEGSQLAWAGGTFAGSAGW